MAFTHTPKRAHSMASDFVSAATPALLAQYVATSYRPRTAPSDAILMMRPYFRSIMCRPNIWQARNVPVKLMSKMWFQSANDTSSVALRLVDPAELTRIWTPPNSLTAASSNASIVVSSLTSHGTTDDLLPRLTISFAAVSPN